MEYELINTEENAGAFLSHARRQTTAKQERDADIGDAVHFWDMVDARCRAATVTQDDLATVWLTYLMPGVPTPLCVREVPHDEGKAGPSWHWPCGGN